MALPSTYKTTKDYFHDSLNFLHKYQWIYNYPNTNILSNKILKKIPQDWINYFKNISNNSLNNLALGVTDPNAPTSLKELVEVVNGLRPKYVCIREDLAAIKNSRVSQKKAYEISCLAPVIDKICKKNGIKYVVDIGSGLGYLPQLLNEKYNYKVLGIEGNEIYVNTSNQNQLQYFPSTIDSIRYTHHYVTKNSTTEILNLIHSNFPDFNPIDESICIVALHACADLTIQILNIFQEIPFARNGIVMPCCYHRLEGTDDNLKLFPLSFELKKCYGDFDGKFLTRPFLRLACQQTNILWENMTEEQHLVHSKNCLFRNILQEIIDNEKINLGRKKRKTGSKTSSYTIEEYAAAIPKSYQFETKTGDVLIEAEVEKIQNEVIGRYQSVYKDCECLIEGLTALQTLIQSVCENIVLLDRCVYMKSLDVECCTRKVTDDKISPRCLALVVTKREE